MADIIPFGKYKGRSIAEVAAIDVDYSEWLMAQPWFKEKFMAIYNAFVIGGVQAQESPEHNEMQVRFLDSQVCLSLCELMYPGELGHQARRAKREAAAWEHSKADEFRLKTVSPAIVGRSFEEKDWDVSYWVRPSYVWARPPTNAICRCEESLEYTGQKVCKFCNRFFQYKGVGFDGKTFGCDQAYMQILVELKPDIGDDYPVILRQVLGRMIHRRNKYGRTIEERRDKGVCVIARRAEFSTVTWEQVCEIFTSSDIKLFRESDLEEEE